MQLLSSQNWGMRPECTPTYEVTRARTRFARNREPRASAFEWPLGPPPDSLSVHRFGISDVHRIHTCGLISPYTAYGRSGRPNGLYDMSIGRHPPSRVEVVLDASRFYLDPRRFLIGVVIFVGMVGRWASAFFACSPAALFVSSSRACHRRYRHVLRAAQRAANHTSPEGERSSVPAVIGSFADCRLGLIALSALTTASATWKTDRATMYVSALSTVFSHAHRTAAAEEISHHQRAARSRCVRGRSTLRTVSQRPLLTAETPRRAQTYGFVGEVSRIATYEIHTMVRYFTGVSQIRACTGRTDGRAYEHSYPSRVNFRRGGCEPPFY